jgi:predicted Zn-dependent protease
VIETVTVAQGDTAATMARRMADPNPSDLFLLLNGKDAGQALRPGERVKIVTWGGQR